MITQVEGGPAVIDVELEGLDAGDNDWHVHEWPVTGDDCGAGSTGGHYNTDSAPTTGELSANLGVLTGPSVSEQYETETVSLFETVSIMGRSIVIHDSSGARVA